MKDSNIIKLNSIIDEIVNNKLCEIEKTGIVAIRPGNNGPYYNDETNVRNMAHWCVTFSKYYEKTSDEKYLSAVKLLADAILDSEHYNGNGVYKCRDEKSSDEVNGVIGAAWIIEGLIHAYEITKDERYLDRSYDMFVAVPFNEDLAIWNRINTKGKKLSVDATFNHQLWFAAAGAMIYAYKKDDAIAKNLDAFIAKLSNNITIRKDGRIGHFTMNDQNAKLVGCVGRIYRDLKNDVLEILCKPSLAYKEAGYHAFNLYGFAILKEYYSKEIPFLNTTKFRKSLDYIRRESYVDILVSADRKLDATKVKSKLNKEFNLFSFSYNSPAFELPMIYKTFSLHNSASDESLQTSETNDSLQPSETNEILHTFETNAILQTLCAKQIEYTYDDSMKMFSKNTDDGETLTARIYEYVAAM